MKQILSRVRRAVEDYGMIEEGDRIAVGVSGGKDSLLALAALDGLRRFYPKKFELMAITLDLGGEDMDFSPIKAFCKERNIPYIIEQTDIRKIVFDYRQEKNPCALCANLRRGALNNAAKAHSCNKVVLGHHYDDVIETFYLSLFFEGQLGCFSPVTYLTRSEITVIRPLIYVEEKMIRKKAKEENYPVVENTCPADKNTKRSYVKEVLRTLDKENRGLKDRAFTALVSSGLDGWKPIGKTKK
ncbi:MAG: tRNA 2-thiocytidine(32) synthetase TtcA [Clostridia bacterium]|nr:tRNA 2-thiocytidine(32) synthetase TtcA [Clostridia bacterium]